MTLWRRLVGDSWRLRLLSKDWWYWQAYDVKAWFRYQRYWLEYKAYRALTRGYRERLKRTLAMQTNPLWKQMWGGYVK